PRDRKLPWAGDWQRTHDGLATADFFAPAIRPSNPPPPDGTALACKASKTCGMEWPVPTGEAVPCRVAFAWRLRAVAPRHPGMPRLEARHAHYSVSATSPTTH